MEGDKNPKSAGSNEPSDENVDQREELIEPETGELMNSKPDVHNPDLEIKTDENLDKKESEDKPEETDVGSPGNLNMAEIQTMCDEVNASYARFFIGESPGNSDESSIGNFNSKTVYIGQYVPVSLPDSMAIHHETLRLAEDKDIEVNEGRMDELPDESATSDKDLGFEEITESNQTAIELPLTVEVKSRGPFEKRREFLIDEGTSSKSSSNSAYHSPSGESSGDSYHISNVYVSEGKILDETGTTKKSQYKRNLRHFLKDSETRKKLLKITKRSAHQKTVHATKKLKTGKSFSDIFSCCGILSGLNSVLRKIKTGRKSNSAPPTFEISDSPKVSLKCDTSEASCSKTQTELLHISETKNAFIDGRNSTKLTSIEPYVLVTERRDSPANSTPDLPGVFKIPIPFNHPKISSKNQCSEISSPGTTKISKETFEKSPSNGVRRPTDLNVSPRSSCYIFSPDSPTGILRQCRSLPNISQNPRKEIKRASMNFDKRNNNKYVKALFTGEMEPTTPESLISQINPDDAAKNFLTQTEKEVVSSSKSPANSICDNLTSKTNIRNSVASRKRLIFKSPEDTNIYLPLQVSPKSADISTNIACLEICDTENQPSPIITLPETPPKRKISSCEYSSPDCKKIRLEEQSIEKEHLIPPVAQCTDVEQTCSNVKELVHDNGSTPSTSKVVASDSELNVPPSLDAVEVTEESKKAKKRTKKMTEADEQIEPLTEPKKKKEDF